MINGKSGVIQVPVIYAHSEDTMLFFKQKKQVSAAKVESHVKLLSKFSIM